MIRSNDIIHAPNRLQTCVFLSTDGPVDFGRIRDMPGAADSVTSKHLKVLDDAGWVKTWAELTPEGARAFAEHVAALKALIAG